MIHPNNKSLGGSYIQLLKIHPDAKIQISVEGVLSQFSGITHSPHCLTVGPVWAKELE